MKGGSDGRLRLGVSSLLIEPGPPLHLMLDLNGALTNLWLPRGEGRGRDKLGVWD